MHERTTRNAINRREFLGAASGAAAAALTAGPLAASALGSVGEGAKPGSKHLLDPSVPKKKIPIGVFDPVYADLSLDQMLDRVSALGLEAMEIGTGGYPGASHCPVAELLADAAKARAWKKKFEDRGIRVATLSCHGNPLHPDAKHAARDAEIFRNTVRLAEILDVKVIVGFSGCPGGSPTDAMPNWITYRWPPEYGEALKWQWKEKVIPYWKEAAKFAREHGIKRLAFEMHPCFVVYNPKTLLQLATGALVLGARLAAEVEGGLGRIDHLVCSVPAQHMFGLECSVMLPLVHGTPVLDRRPLLPADVAAAFDEVHIGVVEAW